MGLGDGGKEKLVNAKFFFLSNNSNPTKEGEGNTNNQLLTCYNLQSYNLQWGPWDLSTNSEA